MCFKSSQTRLFFFFFLQNLQLQFRKYTNKIVLKKKTYFNKTCKYSSENIQ